MLLCFKLLKKVQRKDVPEILATFSKKQFTKEKNKWFVRFFESNYIVFSASIEFLRSLFIQND